jgi:LmbE family N-acetylglucosaminyl deacetylase
MNTRAQELEAAMKVLEVDEYEILLRDSDRHLRLEMMPRRDLVDLIERKGRLASQKSSPTMIVLPAPSYNQDHEAVYRAGITACRPHHAQMKSFQSVVLVADAPQLGWGTPRPFKPNLYVDITGMALERKIKAYECHRSQLRPSPSSASVDAVRILAQTRGQEIAVDAAEAFETLRFVL